MGDELQVSELFGFLYWLAIARVVLHDKPPRNQRNTKVNIYFLLPSSRISWESSASGAKGSSWDQWPGQAVCSQ